jgi:CRP-like cAMP-binding protein
VRRRCEKEKRKGEVKRRSEKETRKGDAKRRHEKETRKGDAKRRREKETRKGDAKRRREKEMRNKKQGRTKRYHRLMFFIIITGSCRLERSGGNVVGRVEVNKTFGEIAFLLYGCATSSVVADADKVEVIMVERQYVNILYELNPEVAGRFFKYLASALQKTLYLREKQLYFNVK